LGDLFDTLAKAGAGLQNGWLAVDQNTGGWHDPTPSDAWLRFCACADGYLKWAARNGE
jgi:hypothetical protein